MHARNRAMRRTAFFRHILSPDVVERILLQRGAGISALLRAIMHQPVLADIEITRAGAAAPLVGTSLRNIVLKGVDAGEATLLHRLHLVVDALLFVGERLQLAAAVMDDADGRSESQAQRAFADVSASCGLQTPPPTTELMFT